MNVAKRPVVIRQEGFTLLEILIATVLLAVMITLLLGAFRVAAGSWEKGERRASQINRMMIVSNFLRSQIGGAMAIKEAPNPMQANQSFMTFVGQEHDLRFMGTIPAQVHGGVYQFELYMSNESGGDEHTDLRAAICPWVRTTDGQPQPRCLDQEKKIDDVAVVEDLEDVSFHYFTVPNHDSGDPKPQGPLNVWESEQMPAYVSIDITPKGEDPWPTIVIEPRADAVK